MPDQHFKVVILGSTAAGKSSFIGGLGILGGADQDSGIQVHARENKDSKGLEYLKRLKHYLKNQEWPPPSHTTEIIDLSVFYHGSILDLTLVDYPGRDFQEELTKLDPEKNQLLFEAFQKANFLLVLLDPKIDLNIGNEDFPVLKNQALERQEAILQVIREKMIPNKVSGSFRAGLDKLNDMRHERIPKNIGLVITKKDQIPQLKTSADAESLLKSGAGQFYQNILDLGSKVQVFALSAVGNTETLEVDGKRVVKPARVLNPVGYNEIFDWIIRARKIGKRAKYTLYASAFALLGAIFIGHQYQQSLKAGQIALDDDRTTIARVEALDRLWLLWPWGKRSFQDPLVDKIAEDYQVGVERLAGDSNALINLTKEIETIRTQFPRVTSSLDKILMVAREKREDSLFSKLKIDFENKDSDFVRKANDYLREFGSPSRHSADLDNMKTQLVDEVMAKDKLYVHQFQITNPNSIWEKAGKVKEFATKWKNSISKEQVGQMQRAAKIAEELSNIGTTTKVTLDVCKTKNLGIPLSHYLRIYLRNPDERQVFESTTSSFASEWKWENKDLDIGWAIGNSIEILLREDGYAWNRDAAKNTLEGSFSILDLVGDVKLKPINGYDLGQPIVNLTLKLNGEPVSENDRNAFLTYFVQNSW